MLSLAALGGCADSGEDPPEPEVSSPRPTGLGERERLAPGASLGNLMVPRPVVFDETPRPEGIERVQMFILGFSPGSLDGEELPPETRPSFFWKSPALPGSEWPLRMSVGLPSGLDLIGVRDVDGDGVPGPADRRSAAPIRRPEDSAQDLRFVLSRSFIFEGQAGHEEQVDSASADLLAADLGPPVEVAIGQDPTDFLRVAPSGVPLTDVLLHLKPPEGFVGGARASILVLGYPESTLSDGAPSKRRIPTFLWRHPESSLELPGSYEAVVVPDLALFLVLDIDNDGKMSAPDYRSGRFSSSDPVGGELEIALDIPLAGIYGPVQFDGDVLRLEAEEAPTLHQLRVEASADYGSRWDGTVFVLGYVAGGGDVVPPDALPQFVWRQKSVSGSFPLQLSVPLVAGLEYVLVLDITGDGLPSAGDAATIPWELPQEGTTVLARVRRVYSGATVAIATDPPIAPKEEAPRVTSVGGGKLVQRGVTVQLGGKVPADWASPLMIVGFPEDAVENNHPARGGRHQFFYETPQKIDSWPKDVALELPEDLLYFAVLDRDGNRRPSPGDWSSSPFSVGARSAVEVAIARTFGPDGGGQPDEGDGADDDDDDDDDDDSSEEMDSDYGEGADDLQRATVLPIGTERSVLRRVVIDAAPRVPFLRRSRILVAGFEPGSIERGMPSPQTRPSYFWASPQLSIEWPLRAEVRLPDVPGQTVYVILDLDDNGQPSPGDLSTAALPNYEAPSSRLEAEFLLNKAYSVSVRLTPTRAP